MQHCEAVWAALVSAGPAAGGGWAQSQAAAVGYVPGRASRPFRDAVRCAGRGVPASYRPAPHVRALRRPHALLPKAGGGARARR